METNIAKTFRWLVTNRQIPQFDYHTYELKFQTVFKVSMFSYQCCPCALEHEYVTYISNDGTINEEVYDRILHCIAQGKCSHVEECTENAITDSIVYAIHIAAAANKGRAFKNISWENHATIRTSLFHQTPYSIAFLKENMFLAKTFSNYSTDLLCCVTESRGEPYTVKFKETIFPEICIMNHNQHLLKKFYKVTGRSPSELIGLVILYRVSDMRDFVFEEVFQQRAVLSSEAVIHLCEVAFLYNEGKLLASILDNYVMQKEVNYHTKELKDRVTKMLKELSSVLKKRKSCERTISQHCCDLPPKRSSLSIELTLLTAIKRSMDSKFHSEIVSALKRTEQNLREIVNVDSVDAVHNLVLQDLMVAKTAVLRTILDLGVNINLTCSRGKTLLDKILENSFSSSSIFFISYRMAIELILYENPDVHAHETTIITAVNADTHELSMGNNLLSHISGIDYCMDAKQHGLFGHDGDNLALNFFGHLLVGCGFKFHSETFEIPEEFFDKEIIMKSNPDVLRYIIPNYREIPRSLQLLCRDSLRHHYKGRQIHAFAEGRNVPSRIRDFILLKPTLKTIQHLLDG